mmetsp:Transcript_13618/g.49508  ORF Transcript_13618/g.49508 Transcript_13618/m.49508 type:complete len:687 (+) Transcript_13618:291-2351(+)
MDESLRIKYTAILDGPPDPMPGENLESNPGGLDPYPLPIATLPREQLPSSSGLREEEDHFSAPDGDSGRRANQKDLGTQLLTSSDSRIQHSAAFQRYLSRRIRMESRRNALHRLDNWFRVLKTTADGESEYAWMTRLELLKDLRSIDSSGADFSLSSRSQRKRKKRDGHKSVDPNASGSPPPVQLSSRGKRSSGKGGNSSAGDRLQHQRSSNSVITGLIAAGKLTESDHEREVQLRDLRRVNPRRRIAQNEAVVLVRRKAILVSVPLNDKLSVNAIITHDKVLWLLPGDHNHPAIHTINPTTPSNNDRRLERVTNIFQEQPTSEPHRLVLLMARALVKSSRSGVEMNKSGSRNDLYHSDGGSSMENFPIMREMVEDRSSSGEEHIEDLELEQESWRPFEFRALEALLRCVTTQFNKSIDAISLRVSGNLETVRQRTNSQALDSLRMVKTLVDELEANVNALEEALEEIIRDDIGLQLMNLTSLHTLHETALKRRSSASREEEHGTTMVQNDNNDLEQKAAFHGKLNFGAEPAHEAEDAQKKEPAPADGSGQFPLDKELEDEYKEYSKLGTNEPMLLLDHYVQECEDYVNRIELLQKSIETTEDYIRLGLDTVRNNLLKADLVFNAVSVAIGIGGVIAGTLGINLHNGYEKSSQWWFVGAAAVIAFTSIWVSIALILIMRRMGLLTL